MTWGDPTGLARFTPAKLAYGGPASAAAERDAVATSLAAGVTLFLAVRGEAPTQPR